MAFRVHFLTIKAFHTLRIEGTAVLSQQVTHIKINRLKTLLLGPGRQVMVQYSNGFDNFFVHVLIDTDLLHTLSSEGPILREHIAFLRPA